MLTAAVDINDMARYALDARPLRSVLVSSVISGLLLAVQVSRVSGREARPIKGRPILERTISQH
jgi:hypothetical protein